MTFGLQDLIGFVYTDPQSNKKYKVVEAFPPDSYTMHSRLRWERIHYQGES